MKLLKILGIVLSMAYISGCTTMADSISAKGTGEFRVYEKQKSEVWPLAVEAISEVGLELVTANESSNMILAQRGVTAFSYGENVAIFIEEHEETKCRVEVVSKKAMETNVFAPNWSNAIFKNLDSKLK